MYFESVSYLKMHTCMCHAQNSLEEISSSFIPLGQYLPTENVKDIIRFCHEEGLMLFTDEVG